MTAPRHLKVFLSSPGDVVEERTAAREVLEQLPRDALVKGQITIEIVSWDDPYAPTPLLANLTPQQAIDRGSRPSECDLTVVILWGRMGTPLAAPLKADGRQYRSGTEYEFLDAQEADRPTLVYRRLPQPTIDIDDPKAGEKQEQRRSVNQFFEQFKNADGTASGGYHRYEGVEEFRKNFEQHVKGQLKQLLTATVSMPRPPRGLQGKPAVPGAYRDWLKTKCASVELLGLRLKQGQAVRLNNVYVPLTTPGSAAVEETGKKGRPRPKEREVPSLLLDRLGEGSLYVSGDPGSGKSTFCRWLAWLACEGAVPLAEVEAPDEYREHLPPTLANRLPLLVYLREFWDRLPDPSQQPTLKGEQLQAIIAEWLVAKSTPGLTAELIAAHLDAGTALLVLDGLDEVPPARRTLLLGGLAEACDGWTKKSNRVLVTSRPYGLTDGEIRRLSLPPAPIQSLPDKLQLLLVRRWFRILGDHAKDADATAAEMLRQVGEQGWLSPLTANPLLLTAMCIVFGEGKRLPEDKYELYDRVVDTVLHNRFPDRPRLQLVRARLAVVAHGMHTGDGLGGAWRATPQSAVTDKDIDRMLRTYQERSAWTESHVRSAFEDRYELVSQTGLLLPSGEHHAAFLHLSFQEFLAAQRLADVEAGLIRGLFLLRSVTPEWRNTLSFIYGSLLATSTTPERAVSLLTDLIERVQPDAVGLQLVVADGVEILMRRGIGLAAAVEARIRACWLGTMRSLAAARDRCAIGTALGKLGDPRFRADAWSLRDDALLGFVEIPAGPFMMGSDKARDSKANDDETPQHPVTLPVYYLARWPVTVAQFRAFVEDPGNGGFKLQDDQCLKGVANHPVVNVSWYESHAYCRWLTKKLRASNTTPEPLAALLRAGGDGRGRWQVTLPSEAEWEKAARGRDERIYPWGNEPDPNRANYNTTGIGGTSAVGCFPGGANPVYGVEELSGNVWEWTRSLGGKDSRYPYKPSVSLENLDGPDDVPRGVRNGAFLDDHFVVRAACRHWLTPNNRSYFLGFRVVVSPLPSDL